MNFVLQLSLLLYLVTAYEDKYLTQLVYKFIYNNEKICGDPFFESGWLPAMGDCIIECEPTQYICLVSTVKDGIQKCRELNHNCTLQVRKSLGWSMTYYKTTTQAPRTTSTISTTSFKPFFKAKIEKKPYRKFLPAAQQKLDLKPQQKSSNTFRDPPRYTIKSLESISSNSNAQDEVNQIDFKHLPIQEPYPPSPLPIPPSGSDYGSNKITNQFNLPVKNSLNYPPLNPSPITASSPVKHYHSEINSFNTIHPSDRFASSQTLFDNMEREQIAAAKMVHGSNSAFIVDDTILVGEEKIPKMPSSKPPNRDELPLVGTRVEIVPPMPPLDPPTAPPLRKPSPPPVVRRRDVDASPRCCDWALNGLCDRSWRKVREMCPQSCGTMSCEQLEGIISCTRVIDVDVEECFQTARLHRYFGLKNLEMEEKKALIGNLLIEKAAKKTKKKTRKSKRRKIKMKMNKF